MANGKAKPGWKHVRFGDVVRLVTDRCDPIAAGLERVVGLEHIEPGDLRIRSWAKAADGTTFRNRFQPGQVLFGKRRAYQRKVALADFEGVCSGDIYVLERADPDRLLPDLLPFLCQTDAFLDHAVGTSAGSLSPRTNWTSLASYEFALPPLKRQRQLYEVLNAFDVTIRATRDAATRAEELFESLCSALLFPVRAEGRRGEPGAANSESVWRSVAIEELCRTPQDLALGPNGENLVKADYEGRQTGVPVIFVRDIRPNRFAYVSSNFLSEDKARSLSTHHAMPGDLLVTKIGVPESMGVPPGLAAVVPQGFPCSVMTADVMRIRFDPGVMLPEYAAYLLNTSWGRRQTWRISPGSTTRFKMRLTDFARIQLPVPPLDVQAKTVEHLSREMRAIDALSDRLRASRAAMQCFANQELGCV